MKSVFLVKSPLQLLNSIEAKHYFSLRSEECVLVIMGDRKSQPQMLNLAVAMNEWGKVVVLNKVNLFFGDVFQQNTDLSTTGKILKPGFLKKSLFNVRRLNRLSKAIGRAEYIFAGYARYIYMRHFINITPHKKVYLLDDGNATIQLAKERREGPASGAPLSLIKKIKLYGKRYLQGVKDGEQESLGFFTIYDIQPGVKDELVKHGYKYIRQLSIGLTPRDAVYFIGSPVSETAIMSQQDYVSHIAKARNYFNDREFIYIAHRRESQVNLEEISRELNIQVMQFDFPLEYQLAIIGPVPAVVASFVSSALDTCRVLLSENVKIICFRLALHNSPQQAEIEAIYDYFVSQAGANFSVIDRY